LDASWHTFFASVEGWQLLVIATKALTYGTCFVASGGTLFWVIFHAQLSESERLSIRLATVVSAVGCIALSVLRILLMNVTMSDDWSGALDVDMTGILLASAEGLATGMRIAGLMLLVVLPPDRRRKGFVIFPLLGAALAALSFGLVGHGVALAADSGPVPQWLICVHLLAVAFWLGALWPLHRATYCTDPTKVAAIMQRFGKVALLVVAVLVGAGASLSWQLLGRPEALWQTTYGNLMLGKLAGVACLMGFAAINKLLLTPRIQKGEMAAILALRRSIRTELLVAGLILLATAVLTTSVGAPVLG
jgi:putative copper export protein